VSRAIALIDEVLNGRAAHCSVFALELGARSPARDPDIAA